MASRRRQRAGRAGTRLAAEWDTEVSALGGRGKGRTEGTALPRPRGRHLGAGADTRPLWRPAPRGRPAGPSGPARPPRSAGVAGSGLQPRPLPPARPPAAAPDSPGAMKRPPRCGQPAPPIRAPHSPRGPAPPPPPPPPSSRPRLGFGLCAAAAAAAASGAAAAAAPPERARTQHAGPAPKSWPRLSGRVSRIYLKETRFKGWGLQRNSVQKRIGASSSGRWLRPKFKRERTKIFRKRILRGCNHFQLLVEHQIGA